MSARRKSASTRDRTMISLDEVAGVVTQGFREVMPNLVAQVVQALSVRSDQGKEACMSCNKRKIKSTSEMKGGNKQNKKRMKGKAVANFAITVAPANEPSHYMGPYPKCARCRLHHNGNCPVCSKCQRTGHLSRYCKAVPTKKVNRRSCYGCGSFDHMIKACPVVHQTQVSNIQNAQGNQNYHTPRNPPANQQRQQQPQQQQQQ